MNNITLFMKRKYFARRTWVSRFFYSCKHVYQYFTGKLQPDRMKYGIVKWFYLALILGWFNFIPRHALQNGYSWGTKLIFINVKDGGYIYIDSVYNNMIPFWKALKVSAFRFMWWLKIEQRDAEFKRDIYRRKKLCQMK